MNLGKSPTHLCRVLLLSKRETVTDAHTLEGATGFCLGAGTCEAQRANLL